MFTQVVVLTYQSPQIDSYTYEIPKELEGKVKIGQLVTVPFGKRNPMGIILSIDNRPSTIVKNIKPISSILLDKPILLPYQIELLKFMSSYYFAPMINCLEAMLPDIPKRLPNYQPSTINNQQLPQTLVLVPTINHLPQTLAQFSKAKNYAVYTNEIKTSERFTIWQKILSGGYDYIFGSRSAIFTPCPNLKKIIIFDEHGGAFKDERSPYFDTLTIAEKISALTGAKIEIIDSSPHVTTFYSSISHSKRSEESRSFSLRLQDDRLRKVQTKIISLENDRKLGNYSQISLVLEEIIKRAYAKKLSVLLFLNKKIESGSIYCKNCKHQEYALSQPDTCPNCKSTEIYFNFSNINSLAKEVKKNIPSAGINIIAESIKQSAINDQQLTIDIATSSVFYKLMTKKYDLTSHIYADSLLNFNEYGASEEIYAQIINLKKLTKKLLVIQTYNEELPAIKFAADGNYQAFYKSEIAQRKTLNYPPFSVLIKIITKGKNQTEAESKSQKLLERLSKNLPTTNYQLPVTILGPYIPIFGSNLSYNITLKLPINNNSLLSREKVLSLIRPLIPRSKDVKIIVEPKNLNQ